MSDKILQPESDRTWPLPKQPWVMRMTWSDLLFAHWPIEPEKVASWLPAGVALDTRDGKAWVSENAAHRIAVEWESNGQTKQGVYIPRRDTNSILNSVVGGRIFPGVHHHARFTVLESGDDCSVTMASDDGVAKVHVSGSVAPAIPDSSVFASLESASEFFQLGSLGYSDAHREGRFDGLELKCKNWNVQSLNVDTIRSSYFEDESRFPSGSVEFDCALLMREIVHQWHGRPDLCCSAEIVA